MERKKRQGKKKKLFIDKEQLMTCKIPPFEGWGWGLVVVVVSGGRSGGWGGGAGVLKSLAE